MESEGSVFCPADLSDGHLMRDWPTHGMHERPVWPDCVNLPQMISEHSCELLYYVLQYCFWMSQLESESSGLFALLYTTAVMYCELCDVNPEFFILYLDSLCPDDEEAEESPYFITFA